MFDFYSVLTLLICQVNFSGLVLLSGAMNYINYVYNFDLVVCKLLFH